METPLLSARKKEWVLRGTKEAGGRSGRQPGPLYSTSCPPGPPRFTLSPCAKYLLQGRYTLSFAFFLVEYGMQHTQLVLVLAAERRGGAEREAGPGPQVLATPLEPQMHATGSLLQSLLHPTAHVLGSQGLVSVASGPRAQSRFQGRARLAFPPGARGLPAHHHGCCPLTWKTWAGRDP